MLTMHTTPHQVLGMHIYLSHSTSKACVTSNILMLYTYLLCYVLCAIDCTGIAVILLKAKPDQCIWK